MCCLLRTIKMSLMPSTNLLRHSQSRVAWSLSTRDNRIAWKHWGWTRDHCTLGPSRVTRLRAYCRSHYLDQAWEEIRKVLTVKKTAKARLHCLASNCRDCRNTIPVLHLIILARNKTVKTNSLMQMKARTVISEHSLSRTISKQDDELLKLN